MRKINLKKPSDVRRFLSRTINMVMSDEIDVGKANCIGQLCNIMLRAIDKSEIERRIEEMERIIAGGEFTNEHKDESE